MNHHLKIFKYSLALDKNCLSCSLHLLFVLSCGKMLTSSKRCCPVDRLFGGTRDHNLFSNFKDLKIKEKKKQIVESE